MKTFGYGCLYHLFQRILGVTAKLPGMAMVGEGHGGAGTRIGPDQMMKITAEDQWLGEARYQMIDVTEASQVGDV
jgi:hypothetical protein